MCNLANFKCITISFIGILQENGSKESSELTYRKIALLLKKKFRREPIVLIKEVVDRSKPFCEVKSIRISGISYKVPIEIKSKRQEILALKWIVSNSIVKIRLPLSESLAKEFIDTYNLNSKTIKACEDFHKIAESNKIYTQFRN